jgi:ureidoglycolate hydrolase
MLTSRSGYATPGGGGAVRLITLPVASVTPEAFAPFGVLPSDEGDGHATADLEFLENDGWVNYIEHSLGEIHVDNGAYRCDLLNRHYTHTQTLMPMTGAAVMVVAPAAVDFSEAPHYDTVTAFLLAQHLCVHLRRGTWHWGPYPVGAPAVRIFNVQGRGYPRDNGVVDFVRDHRVAYTVDVSNA